MDFQAKQFAATKAPRRDRAINWFSGDLFTGGCRVRSVTRIEMHAVSSVGIIQATRFPVATVTSSAEDRDRRP
jgi:hypothetical protein